MSNKKPFSKMGQVTLRPCYQWHFSLCHWPLLLYSKCATLIPLSMAYITRSFDRHVIFTQCDPSHSGVDVHVCVCVRFLVDRVWHCLKKSEQFCQQLREVKSVHFIQPPHLTISPTQYRLYLNCVWSDFIWTAVLCQVTGTQLRLNSEWPSLYSNTSHFFMNFF